MLFLVGLFLALRPSGDDESTLPTIVVDTASTTHATTETSPSPATTAAPTPTVTAKAVPTAVRINVIGGRPAGGITRVSVKRGEDMLVTVRSDLPESVHLHGYDLEKPVGPGAPAQIRFRADQTGRFEVELEESGVPIAEISVTP